MPTPSSAFGARARTRSPKRNPSASPTARIWQGPRTPGTGHERGQTCSRTIVLAAGVTGRTTTSASCLPPRRPPALSYNDANNDGIKQASRGRHRRRDRDADGHHPDLGAGGVDDDGDRRRRQRGPTGLRPGTDKVTEPRARRFHRRQGHAGYPGQRHDRQRPHCSAITSCQAGPGGPLSGANNNFGELDTLKVVLAGFPTTTRTTTGSSRRARPARDYRDADGHQRSRTAVSMTAVTAAVTAATASRPCGRDLQGCRDAAGRFHRRQGYAGHAGHGHDG